MGLDLFDEDPHGGDTSRGKRLARKVLGDPRKAPGRILYALIFALICLIVVGVWSVIQTNSTSASGSSYWVVRAVASVLNTMWVLVPVAIYAYWKFVGVLRHRYSATAAETTGWLAESIEHLADEMRSTDGTTRVISTTDHSVAEIREHIDAALRGEPHDGEFVDYYGRGRGRDSPTPEDVDEQDADAEVVGVSEDAIPLTEGEEESFETFDSDSEPNEEFDAVPIDYSDVEDPDPTASDVWGETEGTRRAKFGAVLRHLGRRTVDAGLSVLSAVVAPFAAVGASVTGSTAPESSAEETPEDTAEIDEEWEIPWKVRFAEELKHWFLDLNASLHSDDLLWKLALPTTVSFAGLMLVAKLWVHPLLFLVFAVASILIGLLFFTFSKKRRSRRLRLHRQTEEWSYWDDAAGRVKTVETADVTCYMGWMSGRRYASYNRAEFVEEFALRLHQRTHEERVAPSVLEQFARNIAQMKPNLRGHLEQIERPDIQREIKHAVESSPEQVIDKAGLAMEVIEHPNEDKRLTTDLGHDPRLVAEEYRWMVEVGHVLAEVDVEFEDASGFTTTKTLVYPANKTRLPDMEALHSQFSDRFTGSHGDPYYSLPDCEPTEDLRGFVPTPKVAEMFHTEGGA